MIQRSVISFNQAKIKTRA